MSSYGPPGQGQPEDPYGQPTQPAGHPPVPPPAGGYPPAAPDPQWGQPQPSGPPAAPEPPQWNPPTLPDQSPWAPPQPSSGAPASPEPSQWNPPTVPDQAQWGQPQPSSGAPMSPGAGYPPPPGAAGYPPGAAGYPSATPDQPQWGQPPSGPFGPGVPPGAPTPPKKNNGRLWLIIGLVVVLVLCPCLGLGGWAAVKYANRSDSPTVDTPGITFTDPPSTGSDPTPEDKPTGGSTDDDVASNLEEGDCLVNNGTDDKPEIAKKTCGPGTLVVLSKIPFSTDADRCDDPIFGDEETTATFTHDDSLDFADFVLCLKEYKK